MGLEYLLFKTRTPHHAALAARRSSRRASRPRHRPDIEWHVQPLSLENSAIRCTHVPAITPSRVCNLPPDVRRGPQRVRIRGRRSDGGAGDPA